MENLRGYLENFILEKIDGLEGLSDEEIFSYTKLMSDEELVNRVFFTGYQIGFSRGISRGFDESYYELYPHLNLYKYKDNLQRNELPIDQPNESDSLYQSEDVPDDYTEH